MRPTVKKVVNPFLVGPKKALDGPQMGPTAADDDSIECLK